MKRIFIYPYVFSCPTGSFSVKIRASNPRVAGSHATRILRSLNACSDVVWSCVNKIEDVRVPQLF